MIPVSASGISYASARTQEAAEGTQDSEFCGVGRSATFVLRVGRNGYIQDGPLDRRSDSGPSCVSAGTQEAAERTQAAQSAGID